MGRLIHAAGLGSGFAALALAAAVARPSDGPSVPRVRSEAETRDLDIEFYRARAGRDPHGAADRAQLARLYLARARETGDYGDLVRAEETARGSLKLRRDRNGPAFAILASSLMGQHRFPEALEVAERLVALDSGSTAARATLGEIQLELGRYTEAARTFGTVAMRRSDPAVAPRYALWEELRGHPEAARRLLREARDAARRLHGAPAEQLAWFQLRLGDLALRYGRLDEAQAELGAGLEGAPGDYRLLGAMARLELARGRPRAAMAYGERAVARVLDPVTLGTLYDAHVAAGDPDGAEQ
jgi:tetratricopeptide (TPR) repeat protein